MKGELAIGRYRLPRRGGAAQRHFVACLFVPRSRRERWPLRLAERLPSRLGVELLAAAAGPARGEEPALEGRRLERETLERSVGASMHDPSSITLLGYRGQSRSVRWIFAPGEAEPRWLAKLARAGAGSDLDAERRRLEGLAGRLAGELAASIPRPVAYAARGGWELLVTEALPGATFAAALGRSARDARLEFELFAAAARWLAEFHAATRARPGAEGPPSLVAALRRGENGPWLRRLAEGYADGSLPTAERHGDFWPRNVLVGLDAPVVRGVVDWSGGGAADLPHQDLFDFVFAHARSVADGAGRLVPEEPFRLALLEPARCRTATETFLAGYARAAGIDARWLEPLLDLYLSELAAGVRTLGITPPERRIEVARTWRKLLAERRPAFSG